MRIGGPERRNVSRTFDTEKRSNEGTEGRFDARRVAPATHQRARRYESLRTWFDSYLLAC